MKNFPAWFFEKAAWQEKTLGDVCKINPSTSELLERFYYIDLESVVKGNLTKDNLIEKNFAPSRAQRTLSVNDVIFQMVRPYQQNNYFFEAEKDFPTVASTGYAQIRAKENISAKFLYFYFDGNNFLNQVLIKCVGGTYPAINAEDLSQIKIKIPSLGEQKKIADYFTSLDNAINAQDLKLKFWRDAKKALLQKIFSQEFYFTQDSGEKYPDWQEKTLGEVAEFLQGLTYSPKNISDDGIIVFRSSNIQNDSIDYSDVVKVDIDKKFLPKLQENDILMCVRNGSKNLVGKTALIEKRDLGNTWGAFMMIIRSKEKNNFLYQYFKTNLFSKAIYKDIGTTTVNQITKGMLNNLKIKIPSLEEQKKIAEYFGSLDKIIDAESKILENLRLMKRGLLQKLLV